MVTQREPGDERRMSDVEALMWSLDADPHLSSTFANLTFLDTTPDIARLRGRLERASRLVPRLRRRVASGLGPLNPAWEVDPHFDIDDHLRSVTLPPASTDDDVRRLAADIAATPLDRSRPLWEFTVIDGLPDGRAAMVQKMHHTITDGKGGIRLSVEFIDLERDAPDPPPLADEPAEPAPPQGLGAIVGGAAELTRRNAETARRLAAGAVAGATDLVRDPAQLAATIATLPSDAQATARSLIRQLGVVDPHRSPLWVDRSLHRDLQTFDVPLDAVRDAAHRLGGSVNDLFVSAALGGAGRYHRARGVDVDALRISMPVSTRTDRSAGGNAFAPARVLLPVITEPRARFDAVHERLAVTKNERALGLVSAFSGMVNQLPDALLIRLGRQQVMTVDFTASNVRAAPFDVFIAGALVERNYPLGPVAGTAWNLTTMSYRGLLNLGLHVDTAAVAEPEALAQDIQASFDELIEVARPHRKARKRPST